MRKLGDSSQTDSDLQNWIVLCKNKHVKSSELFDIPPDETQKQTQEVSILH
jgi:hypothetical protein